MWGGISLVPRLLPVQKILHGEEPGYEAKEAYHQNPCPISKCMLRLLPITVSFPGVGLLSMQQFSREKLLINIADICGERFQTA